MENQMPLCGSSEATIVHDLGTFEGFNFRTQSAIERLLTAVEVVNWDHDRQGEAEFWPSGDHPEAALIFKAQTAVTGSELIDLDRLLTELGGASSANFLRIHHAKGSHGLDLSNLNAEAVEDLSVHVFLGTTFTDLRRDAAIELLELYYPDEYATWEKSMCDGLIFDTDRFLDSPGFSVEEVDLGDQKGLLVAPQ